LIKDKKERLRTQIIITEHRSLLSTDYFLSFSIINITKPNWFQVDMGAKENKSCQMEGVSIEPEDELVSCS